MTISQNFDIAVGRVGVATTSDGGHPPEFFAERIVKRIMSVSDTAPEPIKAQAQAFQNKMYGIVLEGINRAIASDRAYRKG